MQRRLLSWLALAGLATLGLLAAACSSDSNDAPAADVHDEEAADLADQVVAQSLTIEMRDFEFAPSTLEVKAGDVIEIAFTNDGTVVHDFTIEHADLDWMMMGEMAMVEGHSGDDHGADFAVHVPLEGAQNATARMRAHEPGEYVFYCTVAGHRELGMEGTITIR